MEKLSINTLLELNRIYLSIITTISENNNFTKKFPERTAYQNKRIQNDSGKKRQTEIKKYTGSWHISIE